MTDQELRELRKWGAEELMGFKVSILPNPFGGAAKISYEKDGVIQYWDVKDWRPDDPATGQIWMCVERMRELGWFLDLVETASHQDMWDGDRPLRATFGVQFFRYPQKDDGCAGPESEHISDANPCLAMLLAMRAALEGK